MNRGDLETPSGNQRVNVQQVDGWLQEVACCCSRKLVAERCTVLHQRFVCGCFGH